MLSIIYYLVKPLFVGYFSITSFVVAKLPLFSVPDGVLNSMTNDDQKLEEWREWKIAFA